MKAESNLQPVASFEINELADGVAEIRFFENMEQIPDEEIERFSFDTYSVTVPSRETLTADIEGNYNTWLEYAKAQEETPPALTDRERIAELEAENEKLRTENDITANALDELICTVLGGE